MLQLRLPPLLALSACVGGAGAEIQTSAPQPADLLFVRLGGAGNGEWVLVDSILRDADLWVDQDTNPGVEYPFQYDLLDAGGEVVFHGSRREPVQIREFLAAQNIGTDPFLALPKLGDLAILIPRDTDAVEIAFSLKDNETVIDLGRFALSEIPDAEPSAFPAERLSGTALPEEAFDIVILGDGYTDAELPLFQEQAALVAAEFAQTEPFLSYSDRINFWRVDVTSAEAGASYDCSASEVVPGCIDGWRDTAFGSVFPLRAVGLLTGQDLWDVVLFQLEQWEVFRAASAAPFDHAIVLVNTPKYGAFGMYATSIYTGDSELASNPFEQGTIHEFGHAFGLLADEYSNHSSPCQQYAVTPYFPNLAPFAPVDVEVRWSQWVTEDVPLPTPNSSDWSDAIGLFRGVGGGCSDLYRPAWRCRMYNWGRPFCDVCTEQLVKRFYQQFDAVDENDLHVHFYQVVPLLPDDGTFAAEWWIDGESAGNGLEPLFTLDKPRPLTVDWVVQPVLDTVRQSPEDLQETIRIVIP